MRAWLRWLAGDVAPAAAVLLLLVPASSWILLRQWRMPVDTAETCRAKALENADPGDVPKISRELDARMAALMADAIPVGEPPDWTEQAGGTQT